jgi:hypothetical protein
MEMPTASVDPWVDHMRRGEFAAAWDISDRVLRARSGQSFAHLPRHQQWLWSGAPVAGRRVLIHCYHGLGDTVQFIRFAPSLKASGCEVQVVAPSSLLSLLRGAPGIDRLEPLDNRWPKLDREIDIESMELAHVFRTTLATLPADVPYLHVEPAPLPSTTATLRVGIVWAAGDWDEARTIPLDVLTPLLRVPDVEWHVLQRGRALAAWPSGMGRVSGSDDVEMAAAVMRALDLVISVDSFPAHLAGALGLPVWTLLAEPCDWRWMVARDDSPWYPTMRLFRQPRSGDWPAVVANVTADLARLARSRRRLSNAA